MALRSKSSEFIESNLHPETKKALKKLFHTKVSQHIATNLVNETAIKQQFLPSVEELNIKPEEIADPIGDGSHSPTRGIVHRYPDRCLLNAISVCAAYCRFCFRREKVGPGNKALTPEELEACYSYIRSNRGIWEVILSGGDPLLLPPNKLASIFLKLRSIPHVAVIRCHTRIPTIEPSKIEALLPVIQEFKPVIVLHINHPAEFTEQTVTALNRLADSGIMLLNQSVLLKDINDSVDTLEELFRSCIVHRIKPYYLHHPDLAKGTSHFRVSIARGQELVAKLRGRVSGICQPTYVLDIPGGYGKIPIAHSNVSYSAGDYILHDYQGNLHRYKDFCHK